MLLLGHAAVSARRGPRGTCQETRAAPWAPAECGVTARSASDGVDVNGIRVHHRRLQYRRYQCGMFRRETPSRPRIPCVYGLEVGSRRRMWLMGIRVPFAVSRFARKARYFGANGERGCWVDWSLLLFRGFAAKSAVLWDGWGALLLHYSVPAHFWNVSATINYPWHTCANIRSCYTCNCCFRAG